MDIVETGEDIEAPVGKHLSGKLLILDVVIDINKFQKFLGDTVKKVTYLYLVAINTQIMQIKIYTSYSIPIIDQQCEHLK